MHHANLLAHQKNPLPLYPIWHHKGWQDETRSDITLIHANSTRHAAAMVSTSYIPFSCRSRVCLVMSRQNLQKVPDFFLQAVI